MKLLRRLSYGALVVAFAQIVFGAIVRITGSGWGCGEHWPKCDGHWFPPLERVDLIIELGHRYLALGVTLAALALGVAAWRRREQAGIGGRGGVLRPAIGAVAVVIMTALLGMVTIKLRLNPIVIVLHLALAMTLLATIIIAAIRAGGFGAAHAAPVASDDSSRGAAARTWRVARIAAVLAFVVLVLGALTANLGAGGACLGFPNCRLYSSPNVGLVHLQLTHRVVALLFALHVFGASMMIRKRPVAAVVKRAAWVASGAIVIQILVAASLVEMRLPSVLQSLHQAVGTLVWITVAIWAALARRAMGSEPALRPAGAPAPLAADRDTEGRIVRRAEPASGASAVLVTPSQIDAETIARFGEVERAGRTYESAITALVAEAEAIADTFDESLVQITSEYEVADPEPAATVTEPPVEVAPASTEAEVGAASTDEPMVAPPVAAEPPADELNYDQNATNCVAGGAHPAPMPALKRPHSVAVIVARGADF